MTFLKIKKYILLTIVALITIGATQPTVTLFTIGDSTMSIYHPPSLIVGWAQVLPDYFTSSVTVVDAAISGRSSKSFIDEGHWDEVIKQVKPGDFVVIQFGHNDEKSDSLRHTDPYTTFTANLKKFVDETRAKGGNPILCTPIVRRYFNSDSTLMFTHGKYPDAVRKLAASSDVPLVDMELKTKALVESYGPDSSKQLYDFVAPGQSPLYPNGVEDNTHLSEKGALEFAKLFIEGIKELNLGLSNFIKSGTVTGDTNGNLSPAKYFLYQNYPNPFNPSTLIKFKILKESFINLSVYNQLGEKLATLVNEDLTPGLYTRYFEDKDLSSGVYYYSLRIGSSFTTKKMMLLK